jgi:hypothetical protein
MYQRSSLLIGAATLVTGVQAVGVHLGDMLRPEARRIVFTRGASFLFVS